MEEVENSIWYYLNLCNQNSDECICHRSMITSPLVRETEIQTSIPRNIIQKELLDKLAQKEIQPLCNEERFIA